MLLQITQNSQQESSKTQESNLIVHHRNLQQEPYSAQAAVISTDLEIGSIGDAVKVN